MEIVSFTNCVVSLWMRQPRKRAVLAVGYRKAADQNYRPDRLDTTYLLCQDRACSSLASF